MPLHGPKAQRACQGQPPRSNTSYVWSCNCCKHSKFPLEGLHLVDEVFLFFLRVKVFPCLFFFVFLVFRGDPLLSR